MDKTPAVALLEHFATLPDPRIARHRWHNLSDILVIAVCAVLCGAESFSASEDFGHEREEWLRQWTQGARLTYVVRVQAETRYSAMRAEHLRMNEYRNFCRDLVAQAREWFTNPRSH